MPPPKDKPNPIAHPSDDFTSTIHSLPYPAIDPSKCDFSGKNVYIVGGTKHIGRGVTLAYAKAGAAVIGVAGRSDQPSLKDDIEAAAKNAGKSAPKFLLSKVDVKDANSVEAAAKAFEKEFGKLDVLVYNTGTLSRSIITETDPDTWWQDFETMIRGSYLAARAFLPLLLKGDLGYFVLVASIGSLIVVPGLSSYQTAKFAQLRIAEFIAAEYGDKGVVPFCIHPGNVPGTEITGGSGMNPAIAHIFTESPDLLGESLTYLTQEKRSWLGGRYVSATWDMPEFVAKKDEIVNGNKLKMHFAL